MPPRLTPLAALISMVAALHASPAYCGQINKPHKPASASPQIEFNRDIRPVLSDNCFACHGPNKTARQANLRFDERESAIADGAIVPGHPEKSALIARVNASGFTLMPPVSSHKQLTATQKALLSKWISQGAKYEVFWAYQPVSRPPVPAVSSTSHFPVRNPIDAFILQKLDAKGISPSAEADSRTLVRRVYLDLTGIPPTPSEVSAYLTDRKPKAYDRVVDRLLASPHFGERMATEWLDEVRYADTVGFHGDQNMNAWAYRDYVIDSFNKNKRFDTFTIEQLAGDLLQNPTPEQLTATCFNRLNMVTREGGAQPKEYLAKYTADRVRTVGMTFLGSTFGCAECHDHKYDPISTRDFYSMGAFFSDMQQWGVYEDYSYTPNPDLKGYNNDSPFPPEIHVESPYLLERIQRDHARIAEIASHSVVESDKAAVQLQSWIRESRAFLTAHSDGWESPDPQVRTTPKNAKGKPAAGVSPAFQLQSDRSVLLTGNMPGDLYIAVKPTSSRIGAIRIEMLPSADFAGRVYRGGREASRLTVSASLLHPDGSRLPIAFRYAGANLYEPEFVNGFEVIGLQQRGWRPSKAHAGEAHISAWIPQMPIAVGTGDSLEVSFPDVPAGCMRVSISPFVPSSYKPPSFPDSLAADLATLQSHLAVRAAAFNANAPASAAAKIEFLESTAFNPELFTQVESLEADIIGCRGGITPVMVTRSIPNPMVMRVLPRGNWFDESGELVEPDLPHFLPGASSPGRRRLTRLDLARWLVSPENPLTVRTQVNRFWKMLFGAGISGQVEDLGAQGDPPTHPELLNWLASEFRSSGWDVKHIVRLIATSSTYRQDSHRRPDLEKKDPGNKLLESQNPRRLEAEMVRDNALAIAGLLNPDMGGPPCFPYQPQGYYANIQFPDRNWIASKDDRQYRRGIYMHWQRTFLHPMLANFDAPSREDCTANRVTSNTPQQALTLLNDPEFNEAARVLAERIVTSGSSNDARLEALFQRALTRSPRSNEKRSLLEFLTNVTAAYKTRPADAVQLLKIGNAPPTKLQVDAAEMAAWVSVCRVVLNLHETITRY